MRAESHARARRCAAIWTPMLLSFVALAYRGPDFKAELNVLLQAHAQRQRRAFAIKAPGSDGYRCLKPGTDAPGALEGLYACTLRVTVEPGALQPRGDHGAGRVFTCDGAAAEKTEAEQRAAESCLARIRSLIATGTAEPSSTLHVVSEPSSGTTVAPSVGPWRRMS